MKKRTVRFPSAMVILLGVIVLAVVLTWLVPGGEFGSHTDPATGETVTTLEDFRFTDAQPVNPLEIPVRIVQAFLDGSTATIVLTYLFMGGGVYILTDSGAFQAIMGWAVRKLKGNRLAMVAGFTTLFALVNLVLSPHSFVAFVPFSILFARAIGYDAMVGVAMALLGGAVSFSTGALLATTVAAQTMVGLPIYSGAPYRLLCMVVLLVPTILYIYRYGERVRTGGRASLVADLEKAEHADAAELPSEVRFHHILTMLLFVVAIGLCVYGSAFHGWTNIHLSATFLVLGVVVGLIHRHPLGEVLQMYLTGARNMMSSAVLAGLAGAATAILNSGGIMYTIVYYASQMITVAPPILYAPVMFTIHLIINTFIVSGGGQAAATMPIMGPIARLCGIPMQSAVLCFNLGDGLGNYILPYSNQLISYIEAGRISYGQWMRFLGKLFLLWVVLAWVMTALSVFVWA